MDNKKKVHDCTSVYSKNVPKKVTLNKTSSKLNKEVSQKKKIVKSQTNKNDNSLSPRVLKDVNKKSFSEKTIPKSKKKNDSKNDLTNRAVLKTNNQKSTKSLPSKTNPKTKKTVPLKRGRPKKGTTQTDKTDKCQPNSLPLSTSDQKDLCSYNIPMFKNIENHSKENIPHHTSTEDKNNSSIKPFPVQSQPKGNPPMYSSVGHTSSSGVVSLNGMEQNINIDIKKEKITPEKNFVRLGLVKIEDHILQNILKDKEMCALKNPDREPRRFPSPCSSIENEDYSCSCSDRTNESSDWESSNCESSDCESSDCVSSDWESSDWESSCSCSDCEMCSCSCSECEDLTKVCSTSESDDSLSSD